MTTNRTHTKVLSIFWQIIQHKTNKNCIIAVSLKNILSECEATHRGIRMIYRLIVNVLELTLFSCFSVVLILNTGQPNPG